ncbi:hypothetical protein C479_00355 [Halovivax asiaticus JCM 14624]|uniref:Uncharacterized protein n=1 Tax=Halovivax asiaticus JCM 14624 TaxID=1227490 RepID=M0BV73_9EURY|nr:hypothetical protein [Halovivax asiaticus]ELZ14313.1 hypothetical protein C479_00355 [Halovivax asiaticus JCM 14624]
MTDRFALDIETVSPTLDAYEKPPDFRDSSYFELLAVCLAFDPADGDREETVLFRDGTDPASELALVERTCDWIEARADDATNSAPCLTYGGEGFDLPHLRGRVKAVNETIEDTTADHAATADRLDRLFDELLSHVDLQPDVWEAYGEYTTLEEACECVDIETEGTDWTAFEHGIDLDVARPTAIHGVEHLTNRDVPVLGERYLELAAVGATETLTCRALRAALDEYGREDITHLFDLADARPYDGDGETTGRERPSSQ